jgi:hypothetical protein
VKRPKAKVLEPILAYVDKRLGSSSTEDEDDAPPADQGATVRVSRDQLMFWRGQLSVTLRWMGAIRSSVQQVYDELGEATGPVREMLESDLFPDIDPAVRAAQTAALTPRGGATPTGAGAGQPAEGSGARAPQEPPVPHPSRRAG